QVYLFFFFQAEDGIRDGHVTGVQTCALPISGVQHVRIRQDHVAFFANGFSRVGGRVTIVSKNAETIFEALVQVVEFCELILRERSEERRVGKSEGAGGRGTRKKENRRSSAVT